MSKCIAVLVLLVIHFFLKYYAFVLPSNGAVKMLQLSICWVGGGCQHYKMSTFQNT